ncbi:MAG: hypothetical protein CL769_05420 [Chloroflexi bacterium]|nr:hypothetical protein [Chloroflexota bacterium]|tara:strand:- start:1619 stop:2482 length:864 start_codon:yes stop_codon:yes gene_type:complete
MDKFYKPNTIAILFNEKLNECELLANKIKNDIKDDFEVFVQNTALSLENGLPSNPDLLISIGGDGTILRCSKVLNGTNCPILGINMGNLGFLCEIDSNEVGTKLQSYLNGNAVIEKRNKLKINLISSNSKKEYSALNDIVISRGSKIRVVNVEALINGNHFATYKGDGIVVSTATGSTAYSLSLGGAILSPASNKMIMKPIAAHTSLMGGLVTEDVIISLRASSNEDLSISVDGFIDNKIDDFDQIDVEIDKENKAFFVRRENFEDLYWSSLAQKLDLKKGDVISGK